MRAQILTQPGARAIASRENPHWREVVQCAESARERRKRGLSFLEGEHLCEAWLSHVGAPHSVVVADEALASPACSRLIQRGQALRAGLPVLVVEDRMWRELSHLVQGESLAFLVPTPRPVLPERIDEDLIYLDRLQDPGNVGSILRSAVGAGIRSVVTAPGTVWVWSPKVLRAAMGAHFPLRIYEGVPWATLRDRSQLATYATRRLEAEPIWSVDLCPPAIWLFGNEGQGIDPSLAGSSVRWLAIPQDDAVESLNVAAAAAVCLFEQRRQRHVKLLERADFL